MTIIKIIHIIISQDYISVINIKYIIITEYTTLSSDLWVEILYDLIDDLIIVHLTECDIISFKSQIPLMINDINYYISLLCVRKSYRLRLTISKETIVPTN